jgi:hypothetical protein
VIFWIVDALASHRTVVRNPSSSTRKTSCATNVPVSFKQDYGRTTKAGADRRAEAGRAAPNDQYIRFVLVQIFPHSAHSGFGTLNGAEIGTRPGNMMAFRLAES